MLAGVVFGNMFPTPAAFLAGNRESVKGPALELGNRKVQRPTSNSTLYFQLFWTKPSTENYEQTITHTGHQPD